MEIEKLLIFFIIIFGSAAIFPMEVKLASQGVAAQETIKYSLVHSWADKLGVELWHAGDFITRRKEVQESFKQAQLVPRVGSKIVEDMAKEIKYLVELKISAVKRVMDAAENTAMTHQNEPVDLNFEYYNAKEMIEPGEFVPTKIPTDVEIEGGLEYVIPPKEILLTPHPNFFDVAVNTTYSSVHVPTNVFDRSVDVIKAIKWSEKLDSIFQNNYRMDPTLSWQFFGSSTGFMRQFPASKWKQDPVDLYDCRLRSWYIEAATSPKDMVILIDSSGSMTGQRKDIAKHVVSSILDTLGPNDFVNIFTFAEEVNEVVPCFSNILVQANMGNIRELKMALDDFQTTEIANVTAALIKAFDLLEYYRTERLGASCNQAIMLISDGVPYNYKEIFEMYNWQTLPTMPVRIFTYLIGREVADVREIKSMACANQGYYVHLSTLAEVREQVLNYIPVMARPLVLGRHEHPVIWTQVYADVVDPKMTDWLWEVKECEEQKENFVNHRKNRNLFVSPEEQDRRFALRLKRNQDQSSDSEKYHLLTTISMPVFDRRENANITEDVLVNEAYWVTITRETKIANLLGVAGTDIPINDIKKLMMPFMLGVNGYAFIVTNNGYVLTHPDLRPVFQDILKPTYNTVDMVEVELMDDGREPRDFDVMLLDFRNKIINQTTDSKWMMVKHHMDDMKRVTQLKRQYFWTAIKYTPFTLVITFPEQYGLYRLQPRTEDEIHRIHAKGSNVVNFFSDRHWRIHPDWLYCKHSKKRFHSPEKELLYFLDRMKAAGWKWPLNRTPPPPELAIYSNISTGRSSSVSDKDSYYCDRNLMQSLVYDARVTEWFSKNVSVNTKDDKGNEFKQRFGITVAFLATHSGLTRWQELYTNVSDERPELDFSENNKRAIDEIWYKRAVEQHFVEPMSFVYSVPFDAGNKNDTLVTASHAVFHTEAKTNKSAPAAVVGFQFQHSALFTLFRNITSNCVDSEHGKCSSKTCASDEIECFVLDNNGYVIIGAKLDDTGRFFGEVRSVIMSRLVSDGIYRLVKIYDYQAVCYREKETPNPANFLKTPLNHLLTLSKWFVRTISWLFIQFIVKPVDGSNSEMVDPDSNYLEPTESDDMSPISKMKEQEFDRRVLINRTRPTTCDNILPLYQLDRKNESGKNAYENQANGCERPFVVTQIPGSNLILLVVDTLCSYIDSPAEPIHTQPYEYGYDNLTLPCYKTHFNKLYRRRPSSCINKHHNESSIELCGNGFRITSNMLLMLIALYLVAFI